MSAFFYLLTEDNYTAQLAAQEPPWGRPLVGVPTEGQFFMTPWQPLAHVVVHSLANHVSRTTNPLSATCCVVASPAERTAGTPCSGHTLEVYDRLVALGAARCPSLPIVVVDGPDGDGTKDALCNSLWTPRSCARGGSDIFSKAS